MKSSISSIVGSAMACALVGTLAFTLASCEQKPSAEKVGKEIDRVVDSTIDKAGNEIEKVADAAERKIEIAKTTITGKIEEVADAAERKIELAKTTITGTTADAAKVVADKTAQTAESVAVKTAVTAKAVDGLAVSSRVKAALIAQPGIKIAAIDINGGAVKLFGTANSPAIRDLASQIAGNVDGVKSVNNYLVVMSKGS